MGNERNERKRSRNVNIFYQYFVNLIKRKKLYIFRGEEEKEDEAKINANQCHHDDNEYGQLLTMHAYDDQNKQ